MKFSERAIERKKREIERLESKGKQALEEKEELRILLQHGKAIEQIIDIDKIFSAQADGKYLELLRTI